MRDALIFGLLLLLGTIFALHDGREPSVAIDAAHIGMAQASEPALAAQAVTNPRGQAPTSLRVAPCVTIQPKIVLPEEDA
jgi:hypothetical protein